MKNLFDFADENIEQTSQPNTSNNLTENTYYNSSSKSNLNSNTTNNSHNNSFSSNSTSKEQLEKDAKNLYEKYKNYSENELMNEFLTTSKSKLKEGTLTKDKIQNTVNSLAPFLNASQNEFLKGLIGKLDD